MLRFFENLADPFCDYPPNDTPPQKIWPYLRDQLSLEFIKYVLRSDRLTRPKYQKLHLEAGSTPFFHLRSMQAIDGFLSALPARQKTR